MKKYTIFRGRLGALSRNLWQGEYAIDRKISVGLFLMLLIALSFLPSSIYAQSVTISNGTSSGYTYGPIYRSSSGSSYDYSACKYLFTGTELAAAGLPPGATITSIEFNLLSTSQIGAAITGTASWDIYMLNSTLTNQVATSVSDITTNFTLVKSQQMDAANNFPGTTGWLNLPLSTAFVYNGGSLEIASLWDCSGLSTTSPTTGSLNWEYGGTGIPAGAGSVYANNSAAITTITTLAAYRPNIKINYTPPPPCTSTPAAGTALATVPTCAQEAVSISLSGGSVNSGISYQLESSPAGTNTWSPVGSAQNSAVFTTVPLVNTDYRIVGTCTSTSSSATSTPVSVTVVPAPSVPLLENFDLAPTGTSTNNTAPTCWQYLEGAGHAGYGYVQAATASHSTPNRYYMYNSTNNSDPMILRSGAVDNLSSGTNRVRFWTFTTSTSSPTVEVGTMSDPSDFNTFTSLAILPVTLAWQEYSVNIPAGTNSFVAFKHGNTATAQYVYLDDVFIEPIPSCVSPSFLTSNILSTSSVSLDWTENNTVAPAGGWLVEYGPSGFTLGTGTQIATTSHPVTIPGLTASTPYQAYVRAICTPGADSSTWSSSPLTFQAGYCVPSVSTTTTYYMNSISTTGAATNLAYTTSAYAAYTDQTTDTLTAQAGGLPFNINITMPTSTHYYYMWADLNQNFSFDDPGEALIATTSYASNYAKPFQIPANIAPGTYTMRFGSSFSGVITSGCGSGRSGSFVDFVLKVLPPPTCTMPSAVQVTSVTPTTATVAWTENNSTAPAGGWLIEYGATGFTPGTGTVVAASTNPFVLPGLTPNTSYSCYVKAVCTPGADSSYWSVAPASFLTLCAPFTAPYTYDVESAGTTTNSSILDCWSSSPSVNSAVFRWDIDGSGSTPTTSTGPTSANSGVKYFYTEANSGVFGDTAKLVSPLIDVSSLTSPYLQYAYHMYGSNMGNLYAQIWNGTSFVTVDSLIGQQQLAMSLPWQIAGIDISSIASSTTQIRFLGIRGNGTVGDMSLDDIAIIDAPMCLNPTAITGTYDVPTGNLVLNWTAPQGAPPAGYNYVVVLADSGYAASNVRAAGSTTSTTASVPGLTSGSSYDIYVQSDCGSGSTSNWTGPYTYLPPCLETLPYTQDFEGTGCLPTCWNKENLNGDGYSFCMAGQVPCAGTKSLRLDPNTSSTAPANNDWAYSPVFNLTAGTSYRIKFTYKSDQAAKIQKLAMYVGGSQSSASQTTLLFKDDSIRSTTCQNVVIDYTPTASGLATFGFYAYAAAGQGNIGFDDFSIDITPAMSSWSVADNNNNDVCTDSSIYGVAGSAWHELHDATGNIVLSINPNGNYLGTVKVKYIDQSSPEEWGASGSGSSAMYKTVPRRFAITPQYQPTSPVDVRFYFQGEELDEFNASTLGTGVTSYSVPALLFTKHEVTTPDCILTNNAGQASLINFIDGLVGTAPTTGTQDFYVESTVPNFSEFTLHEPTTSIGPLSIKFENFAGRITGDKVYLTWNLVNGTTGNTIDIEKLHNGIWRNIGNVDVNATQSYNFTDNEVAALNTYRLSYQGKKSETISIKDQTGTIVSIYPNPADNYIKVEVENSTSSELKVNIYDVVGRTLITKSITTTRNAAAEEIQIGDLPAGNYLIKVEDSSSVLYNSVLIVK